MKPNRTGVQNTMTKFNQACMIIARDDLGSHAVIVVAELFEKSLDTTNAEVAKARKFLGKKNEETTAT
jgi:hypothetical protein